MAIIIYHLNFLEKSFQWIWIYCFFHSYYTYLLGFIEWHKQKLQKSVGMLSIETALSIVDTSICHTINKQNN